MEQWTGIHSVLSCDMTWILTNDDGIDAPGLAALRQAISQPAMIVAPQTHHSGCGHQVTTAQPIIVEEQLVMMGEGQQSQPGYGIAGTPVDCVRVALNHLCPSPSWVLSGINAGGNLGTDIYISGTVAAVREAALRQFPGMAFSQYHRRDLPIDWQCSSRWTHRVILYLLDQPLPSHAFWNVNFPHLRPNSPEPDIVLCQPSKKPLPAIYRQNGKELIYEGDYHSRDREPGSDVDVCFSGNIAVSLIQL